MTYTIEEYNQMLDVLRSKLRYYENKKDDDMVSRLKHNIEIITNKIEELTK